MVHLTKFSAAAPKAQTTNNILMIRPVAFRMNEQTAVNNYYQKVLNNLSPKEVNAKAQEEFDSYVTCLRSIGVNIVVIEDTLSPSTPDSIFPNNWLSLHNSGEVVMYPMFAENRRPERRLDILETLKEQNFTITSVTDYYTEAEKKMQYLEGTGVLILDRINRKAYCALSPRCHKDLVNKFCADFDYSSVIFHAYQTVKGLAERQLIYHTNVMMCVAESFAIICAECIDDRSERETVVNNLLQDDKEVILITEAQVANFAGNMLQVRGHEDERFLIMSNAAYNCLNSSQVERIEKHCKIMHASLDIIEACG
eukprot:Awhi_evm1s10743